MSTQTATPCAVVRREDLVPVCPHCDADLPRDLCSQTEGTIRDRGARISSSSAHTAERSWASEHSGTRSPGSACRCSATPKRLSASFWGAGSVGSASCGCLLLSSGLDAS